jgi:hypothetical protein
MALQDFVDALPEDKRESYKAEISRAVVIASESDAETFASSNELLKKANQRYRDGKLNETKAEFLKNFHEKELPGLLEQKYKEKHPDADPKDLAYKALEEKLNSIQRDGTLKERKAVALQKLAEAGLPVSLADLAIDMDETNFGSKLELLASLKAWKEEEVAKALAEKLGNQGTPKAGSTGTMDFSKMSQTEVMAYARKGPAEEKAVTEWLAKRK